VSLFDVTFSQVVAFRIRSRYDEGMNHLEIDTKRQFPNLPRAPIVEAVVHWQAPPTKQLEQNTLQQKLGEAFDDYSMHFQVNQEVGVSGNPGSFEVKQRTNWEGLRLNSPKEGQAKFVCQFLKTGVVFSQLAPYQDWQQFIEEAKRFWDKYVELAEPTSVSPLTVRYISQVPVHSPADVGNCIQEVCAPLSGMGLEADHFFHQDSIQLANQPYKINVIRAVQPATDKSANLIVDISVSTTSVLENLDVVDDKLEELRFIKNEVFFTLMHDAEAKFGAT